MCTDVHLYRYPVPGVYRVCTGTSICMDRPDYMFTVVVVVIWKKCWKKCENYSFSGKHHMPFCRKVDGVSNYKCADFEDQNEDWEI